jgi:hypothetical protein
MSDFPYSSLFHVDLISVICASIIGIIFWRKQKTKESIVFVLGILLVAFGELIRFFTILKQTLKYVEYNTPSSSTVLFTWHIGAVISSIGLIVTVVGFALVTWKIKRNT